MAELEHDTARTSIGGWARIALIGLVSIAIWVPGGDYGIAVWGSPVPTSHFPGTTRLTVEVDAVGGPGYLVLTGFRVGITRR